MRSLIVLLGTATVLATACGSNARTTHPLGSVKTSIPIHGPTFLRQADGQLWVDSLGGVLSRVDPKTQRITATVRTPCRDECPYLSVGAGRIWVADFDANVVYLVDPRTAKLARTVRIPNGSPEGVAFTPGSAWVANHHAGTVERIDTRTDRVLATIRVGPVGTGGPQTMAASADAVWAVVPNRGVVARIDPATDKVVARVPVDGTAGGGVTATPDAVWVAGGAGDVTRVDPTTNRPVAHVKLPGGSLSFDVATGLGSVWVATFDAILYQVDPRTNRVVARLTLPKSPNLPRMGTKSQVTTAFGAVWATSHDGNTLLRITPNPLTSTH